MPTNISRGHRMFQGLLRCEQIQLAAPNAEWHQEGRWFVVQKGLNVELKKRT